MEEHFFIQDTTLTSGDILYESQWKNTEDG
jgi:hypothetical protein